MNYEDVWDRYLGETFTKISSNKKMLEPESAFHPGDEWGDQKEVSRLISQSFPSITTKASKFVEIGSGGGRYTVPLMNKFPECTVDAFDVSSGYIAKLKQRVDYSGLSDRINIHKLDNEPAFISKKIGDLGFLGKIDVVYSYDAMVHVDLQSLLIYFVNAANILKPMGRVVMNVADATSEKGMERLFSSAARVFRQGGAPSTKFIWHSPSVFQKILPSLGFKVELKHPNGRDLYLIAQLISKGELVAVNEKFKLI